MKSWAARPEKFELIKAQVSDRIIERRKVVNWHFGVHYITEAIEKLGDTLGALLERLNPDSVERVKSFSLKACFL